MATEEIKLVIDSQREYFKTGATLNVDERLRNLRKLKKLIIEYEEELKVAMWSDFHKPSFEVMATESGFVLQEISYTIRHLRKWVRRKRVSTPVLHFIAHSYIEAQPYGQVLILSPWNFPFQLSILPLMGAIAAGNCVIMKCSQQVPATLGVIKKLLANFDERLVKLVEGDHSISDFLLSQKFDYIFFTGSPNVGKYVMKKASENLIPVSLELGGKNPCVVAADAHLEFAAKRIAWGKFINAGQTCVAPDYLLIDRKVKERFLDLLKNTIDNFYGTDSEKSIHFARVVNPSRAATLEKLVRSGKVIYGGKCSAPDSFIEPTIIDEVDPNDPVMKEEIFGPVLPIISYESFDDIFRIIDLNPKPLAAYIFTNSQKLVNEFLSDRKSVV